MTPPTDFQKALNASPATLPIWKSLTPIAQRDWVTWIVSAKQAETRTRRIKVAISKLASGMRRPCCYAVVPMNLYKALGGSPKAKAHWKTLSPDERRDFADWVEKALDSDARRSRVEKVCEVLANGKRKL